MALSGWQFRTPITIPAAQIDGTGPVIAHADFTFILTEASVNSATLTSIIANAKDAGEDLRVSTDEAGSNLLTVDVISFSKAGEFILAVGPTTLTTSSDATFYLWWGNPDATAQTGSAAYDSDWLQYLPLEGDALDRTSNGNDGTLVDLAFPADEIPGQLGTGLDFNGNGGGASNGDQIQIGGGMIEGRSSLTVMAWVKAGVQASANFSTILTNKTTNTDQSLFLTWDSTNNEFYVQFRTTTSGTQTNTHTPGATIEGDWHHVALSWADGEAYTLYLDGAALGTGSAAQSGNTATSTNGSVWGASEHSLNVGWLGGQDEMLIQTTKRSGAWVATVYNNVSDPAAFASSGDPVDLTAGGWHPRKRFDRSRMRRRVA